jgi:hypothetical protein
VNPKVQAVVRYVLPGGFVAENDTRVMPRLFDSVDAAKEYVEGSPESIAWAGYVLTVVHGERTEDESKGHMESERREG